MGNMEVHVLNTTSTISFHQFRDIWKSPRGTVLRIQALAVVAIIFSFFLAIFGSCRRWSNRWIVQKGFFVAQVLSLSVGTYSIGLMQSSSAKSEMYPIWSVSLFTLFGCIDPVTSYNGLDYKGPLSKMVYQICLHCGYVLLMSISTISSDVGNTAIGMLSAITFIKGFHRSLALLQQSRMRNMVQNLKDEFGETSVLRKDLTDHSIVDFSTGINNEMKDDVSISQVYQVLSEHKDDNDKLSSCSDVCVAFSLSHKLHRYFLGLGYRIPRPEFLNGIDYKWAFQVVEVELAFLHDVFFTGNAFLHYYQAKTSCFWALASFTGICFVGIAAATPGTIMSSSHRTTGSTRIVDTTIADLVITFGILVSLALLQLMHLIRSWTSNWARVAVACAYAREQEKERIMREQEQKYKTPHRRTWWLGLKVFVATSSNWFDKYLWQDKIGQYSVLPEGRIITAGKKGEAGCKPLVIRSLTSMVGFLYKKCARLVKMLGLDYIGEVLWDLLGSDTTSKRPAVTLDDDVKASIIGFLSEIETDRLDGRWFSFYKHRQTIGLFSFAKKINKIKNIGPFLPYHGNHVLKSRSHGYRYTSCVLMWHFATWYCELVEQNQEQENAAASHNNYLEKSAEAVAGCFKNAAGGEEREQNRDRRVANALSKYCAYLVVSAPELLPGPAPETKRAYDSFAKSAREIVGDYKDGLLGLISDTEAWRAEFDYYGSGFWSAMRVLLVLLEDDPEKAKAMATDQVLRCGIWETLADVWVRMLVYAAPYGNVEAHMRHLSQGGEFITHLWALLYHLDIREWKLPSLHNITTVNDVERILNEDNVAVVALVDSLDSSDDSKELVTASRLERGVRFYQTSSRTIAMRFHIDQAANCPALVLWNNDEQFIIYDGEFRAFDIAGFVTANKLAFARQARAQETTPCTIENTINNQISEDGGNNVNEIEEEILPLP